MTTQGKADTKNTSRERIKMYDNILEFIAQFKKSKRRVPSQMEIAKELDISRQLVRYHMTKNKAALRKKYPAYGVYK